MLSQTFFSKSNKSIFLNFKESARDYSYKYFLSIEMESIAVCKWFFIRTFDVTISRVRRTLKVKVTGRGLRGKMKGSQSSRYHKRLYKKFSIL